MAATRNRRSPDPVGPLRRALFDGLRRAAGFLSLPGLDGLRCVAGLSGGRDSVVLLHALAALRAETGIQLSALHVHHGLSPNADAWAAFCVEFCKLCQVPLAVERVEVDRACGQGLEGAARAARHAAFAATPADVIALAHHAGDQAETMLFNLLRGAGLNGATGMAELRPGAAGAPAILRPWLEQAPEAIEAYRALFGLAHVADESNRDTAFSRNFLRHDVLAPIERRFPGATVRLAGAARRLGEARALLAELADADLASVGDAATIAVPGLLALDPRRRKNALRRWLERRSIGLGEDGLDELGRQLAGATADAQIGRRCGDYELRLWRARLYAVRREAAPPAALAWNGEPELAWGGGRLAFEAVAGEGIARRLADRLELRPRQGGERLRLRAGGPTRPLRLLFQESALPPWERARLPLVWRGDALVAVPGVGVAAEFAATAGEPGWRLRWAP